MSEQKSHSRNFIKDIFWYTLGTIIPILVSLLRTPVFTRYFTAEEFGVYGLAFITFSIISVFLYTWMSNAVWRFFYKFKRLGKLDAFYTNIVILFLVGSIVFTLLATGWVLAVRNSMLNRLVIYILVQTFLSQLVSFLLIIFRLENKASLYTAVHSFRAIVSFGIQCMITFVMGMRIEAIPIASMVTEILILLFIIKPIRSMITIRFELVSRRILKYIGSYFLPGIVSNISTILLTLSDRYIISLYGTMSEVGIYNQIYNFAQVSIVALISIFFAVINPEFFNILEQKPDKIKDILVKYHLTYILFILPMVAYISIFAEPITNVLFGEEFRVGYTMIPFIAFSYYINGLINFRDTKLKFENRYRIVIIGFILSTVLNIALNFIFLPIYGYKTAAVTTLIAYGFLYLYYQYYDRIHLFENARFRNTLLIICSILVVQTVTHYLIKNVIKPEDNLLNNILEGLAYVSVYAFLIVMLFRRTMKQLMTKENI